MVEAIINAQNPRDNALRFWGIGIDEIPRGNWVKDESVIHSTKSSGESWVSNVPLADGKHVLYFVVSQPNGPLGGYSGEIALGSTSFEFDSVDTDTVFAFEVDVKDGKVKTSTKGSNLETEEGGNGSNSRWNIFSQAGKKFSGMKTWMQQNQRKTIIIFAGIGLGGVGAYLLFRYFDNKKKRF